MSDVIENIYSSESEGTDTNNVQVTFKMPKNVRQVGKSNTFKKIYVEDYVMTYMKQLTGGDFSGYKIAVLTGQCIKAENCRNIFISGAVQVNGFDTEEEIIFTNEVWTQIYEDIKKYFVEAEIVGWFLGGPGYLLEEQDKIHKIHVDNFAGQDKVLLTYDNMEREEAFFCYENNRLTKQEGYYIYYEKNEEMQTYMINSKNGHSIEEEYEDKVSKEIRTVLQNKKPPEEDKNVTRLMYAAGTLLAVIILVVAAAILNNYDQMKSMQTAMDQLSVNMQELQTTFSGQDETESTEVEVSIIPEGNKKENRESTANVENSSEDVKTNEQSLEVEVVSGDVQPLEETQKVSPSPQNKELANEEKEDNSGNQKKKSAASKKEVTYYTVVSGDTLADISFRLYHTYTKVNKIMELNGIEDQDLIYVGQKLIVP